MSGRASGHERGKQAQTPAAWRAEHKRGIGGRQRSGENRFQCGRHRGKWCARAAARTRIWRPGSWRPACGAAP